MTQIPRKLRQEPLIEAIWELRFEGAAAGEILPGQIYTALKKNHENLDLQRLPTADLPAIVAQINPNLRYAPKLRLQTPSSPLLWQTGDRIITLNCRKPYIGWLAFKPAIEELIGIIEESSLDLKLERHSLRYIDLLTLDPAPDISALQLTMQLGSHPIKNDPMQTRFELVNEPCRHVVQIVTPAEIPFQDGVKKGTLVDLETFAAEPPKDFKTVRQQLDFLHDKSKKIFFEDILSREAMAKLGPEY
jgi:uncharacterized protein (TIGR04255 family)